MNEKKNCPQLISDKKNLVSRQFICTWGNNKAVLISYYIWILRIINIRYKVLTVKINCNSKKSFFLCSGR